MENSHKKDSFETDLFKKCAPNIFRNKNHKNTERKLKERMKTTIILQYLGEHWCREYCLY